jgi:hypothetical protein
LAKLITYDLITPGKDYEKLWAAIKSYSSWCKVTESCYIISSSSTCTQIRDYLKQFIDNNDRLFVANLTGETAWVKVQCKNDYLKNILNQ